MLARDRDQHELHGLQMHSPLRLCILALAYACAACGDDTVVEIGRIEGDGAPVRIQVPSVAAIGEPALIRVVTYGDGCVSFEETEITVTEAGAQITPYDRRVAGRGCPLILLQFNHDTTVRFESAGSKVIRIDGRRTGAVAGERFDENVQLTFPMTVE